MLKRVSHAMLFVLLMSCFATAAFDYLYFAYRQRTGNPLNYVTVHQYLATPLKNGRDELDYLGEMDQPCVEALLPHQHLPPCWWMRRHKDHWTRS